MATGNPTQCAVLHAPGYVPGEHAGEIHLYRSLKSTAEWWLCDFDAEDSVQRTGIPLECINEPEENA